MSFSQGPFSSGQGGAQVLSSDGKPFQPERTAAQTSDILDAGLAFVWHHRKRLLQGGFIAGIVEIFLTYLQYFLRMSQQQMFLVVIMGVGAIAWLMTYVGVYCLNTFRGESISPSALSLRAVQCMPKVVLSYVVLVALAIALFAFQPFLLLAVFGIWAPAFCVAEIFALPLKPVEEGPDDAFEDEVVYRKVIHFRFFQGRPLWDLGFARSIAFVGQHFAITLQFAVLAWAMAVVPAGAMLMIAGYYPSFSSVMIEVLISNLLQAMLLGAGMVCFLLLLPQEARNEIGLPGHSELMKQIPREGVPELLQPGRKKYPFLVVVLLGLLSTGLTWKWIKYQHTMPESVQVQFERAEQTKDRLIVTLQITDDQQLFRWLDSDSLRLRFTDVPVQATTQGPPTSEKTAEKRDDSSENLIQPERVMPYGIDGTPLDESNFTPYSRPLRLVLYFAKPEVAGRKFALYHESLFGLGKPIAEGEIASDKSQQDADRASGAGVQDGKPA